MTEQHDKTDETLHSVEEVLGRSELFIEKNQKPIFTGLLVVIILVLGYFGFQKYIQEPKEKKATSYMFAAERYFDQDSVSLALNGDGDHRGFIEIIDEFGGTKSGNLAKYYAGICYLKLGEFDKAIDMLKGFSSDDEIVGPMATAAIGDAYFELGQTEKAAEQYKKAANEKINDFTTPQFLFKAGLTYESLNKNDEALTLYERIQKDFPKSEEARSIEKYIARVNG